MKSHRHALAALAIGAAAALPASAQTIKPGLWEMTSNMGGQAGNAMAELQKQMADMDPQERKMMQQMMAKQGVQMSAGAGGGMVTKVCISPDMAKRGDGLMQQKGDCSYKNTPMGAGKYKYTFSCANPKTTGEGEVSFTGDTAYKSKMKVVSGRETMTMDASGKWLGADCGAIKPLAVSRAK